MTTCGDIIRDKNTGIVRGKDGDITENIIRDIHGDI